MNARILTPDQIKIRKKGHAFLLNEILSKGVAYKTMISSGGIISISARLTHLSTTGSIVFSVLFSLYLVLLYGDCFFIPLKIRAHFNQQFPQLAIN